MSEEEKPIIKESKEVKKNRKANKKKKRKLSDTNIDAEKDVKDTKETKEERKLRRQEKKAKKAKWMAMVPSKNEDGIAYTKLQMRRMMQRVKNGLPPVPTVQEEQERNRQLKLEREQEEKELSGMMYSKDDDDSDDNDKEDGDDNDDKDSEMDGDDGNKDQVTSTKQVEDSSDKDIETNEVQCKEVSSEKGPESKKKKRSNKPVPSDYICFACKNKHQPLHWIYDCPDKIHQPGIGKKSKKQLGLHDPSPNKVFVSGLSFTSTAKSVKEYFQTEMKCGEVKDCKILSFEDSKRCNGQAIITFDSEASAKKALKLNETIIHPSGDKEDQTEKKKELTLIVTELKNRAATSKAGKKGKGKFFRKKKIGPPSPNAQKS